MTTTLRVQPDYKTYKLAIKNKATGQTKSYTRTLKNGNVILTWNTMLKAAKHI